MELVLNEKQFLLLKENLQNQKLINEAEWYNTLGDILGIFDPTGVVDFVNGISYMKQGDTLFGVLSMVSVLPYIGDLAAKPLLLLGKSGKVIKNTENAMKLLKSGNVTGATKIIDDLSKTNKTWAKLVNSVRSWGPKLIEKIDNLPGGILTKGIRNTIIDWIKLFSNANKGSRSAIRVARRVSGKLKKGARLSPVEAENVLKEMKKLAERDQRLFRGLGGKPKFGALRDPKGYAKWSWEAFKKYPFSGGIGRLWGNREVRGLMRRTKWWLGFLDWVGLANFVGPDELQKQMGDYTNELEQYAKTPESESYWQEDFGQVGAQGETQTITQTTPTQPQNTGDLLSQLLFGGIPGITKGVPGI